jgi:hypothetical protein
MSDVLNVVASALAALVTALVALQDEIAAARRVLAVAGPTDPRTAVDSELAEAAARFRAADLACACVVGQALLANLAGSSALPTGARASPVQQAAALTDEVAVVPQLPSAPAAVAVWWAGLSAGARAVSAAGWPGWPAGTDGIPIPVRDAINRRLLAGALSQARQASARVPKREFLARRAAADRVTALQSLAAAVRLPGSQLLVFDPTGDGEAVVSTAAVESSSHVAIVVPGMENELDNFAAFTADAQRLAAAARPGTAVIAWLGYDAPHVRQVFTDARAKAGAATLQRFVAGLRATASRLQQVTVLGHSYGSLVAGLAAKSGLAADDLVLLASPGVEANRASELHLPPGHVWAAEAPTDPIRLIFLPSVIGRLFGLTVWPVFGPDPSAASFRAHHFPDGGAYGHSGYFSAGSQSLASLAAIVSGRPPP